MIIKDYVALANSKDTNNDNGIKYYTTTSDYKNLINTMLPADFGSN